MSKSLTKEERKSIPDWIKGKPFVVIEPMLRLPWGGVGRSHFGCDFCMKLFEVGDVARWVYVEGRPNIFVCEADDGPDVAERFTQRWDTVIRPILKRWGDG
jgi:hypothetical protein